MADPRGLYIYEGPSFEMLDAGRNHILGHVSADPVGIIARLVAGMQY